jgi:L-lactate dehydrogenase complex protein LldG
VTAAREAVLARIREALGDGVPPPTVPRDYVTRGSSPPDVVVARFVERVEEAGAGVLRADDTATTVAAVLAQHGASRVVVAPDLAVGLRPVGVDLVEDGELAPRVLDALDGAVTTCAVACADTGSIALDGGPGQGRRAITLVPDLHVCIVRPDQIVETVPEFLARLERPGREGRPIVIVSGPSATSDLGFERVEGVHGPRRLVVVLVGGDAP